MSRSAKFVVVALLLVAPPVSLAADRAATVPGPEAAEAIAVLAAPSRPQPLPGDPSILDGVWAHPGSCADLTAAYGALGDQVPQGSTVAVGHRNAIVVTSPFATTGIFVAEDPDRARCRYSFSSTPTVSVVAPGTDAPGRFLPVSCTSLLGFPLVVTEIDDGAGGVVGVLATQPNNQPWVVIVAPGTTIETMIATSEPSSSMIQASGEATYDGVTLAFDGSSPAGPVSLRATCTAFPRLPNGGG